MLRLLPAAVSSEFACTASDDMLAFVDLLADAAVTIATTFENCSAGTAAICFSRMVRSMRSPVWCEAAAP